MSVAMAVKSAIPYDSPSVTINEIDFPISVTCFWRIQLKVLGTENFFDIRVWGIDKNGRTYPRKGGLFCNAKTLYADFDPYFHRIKHELPSL